MQKDIQHSNEPDELAAKRASTYSELQKDAPCHRIKLVAILVMKLLAFNFRGYHAERLYSMQRNSQKETVTFMRMEYFVNEKRLKNC